MKLKTSKEREREGRGGVEGGRAARTGKTKFENAKQEARGSHFSE